MDSLESIKPRILVADDEMRVLKIFQQVLSSNNKDSLLPPSEVDELEKQGYTRAEAIDKVVSERVEGKQPHERDPDEYWQAVVNKEYGGLMSPGKYGNWEF